MQDMQYGDLHSVGAKLAYMDTQLKVSKYAMKQNSDILWYPIKNVDIQFTKTTGAYLNDLKFSSGAMMVPTLSIKFDWKFTRTLACVYSIIHRIRQTYITEMSPYSFGNFRKLSLHVYHCFMPI